MKQIIFLILFLSTNVFAAGLSGNWNGTGDLLNFDQKIYGCQSVSLEIESTVTTLHIKKLSYICEDWEFGWDEIEATIQDGQVIYGGVGVGTITENEIHLHFLDTENDLSEVVHFKKTNGVIQLRDELRTLNGSRVYTRLNAELGQK